MPKKYKVIVTILVVERIAAYVVVKQLLDKNKKLRHEQLNLSFKRGWKNGYESGKILMRTMPTDCSAFDDRNPGNMN